MKENSDSDRHHWYEDITNLTPVFLDHQSPFANLFLANQTLSRPAIVYLSSIFILVDDHKSHREGANGRVLRTNKTTLNWRLDNLPGNTKLQVLLLLLLLWNRIDTC